jgi:hypothetical protein
MTTPRAKARPQKAMTSRTDDWTSCDTMAWPYTKGANPWTSLLETHNKDTMY